MIVTFNEIYLKNLYVNGDSGDKKHRFQPTIVTRYQRYIKLMESVTNIISLAKYNSLNYEVLQGDKKGMSSIRVNNQYRIEFTVTEMKEPVVTICNILKLSNHYK